MGFLFHEVYNSRCYNIVLQDRNMSKQFHCLILNHCICRYKVWNIYGAQLYSSPPSSEELYEVAWRQCPDGFYPVPEIKAVKSVPSVQQQQQQGLFRASTVIVNYWRCMLKYCCLIRCDAPTLSRWTSLLQ